MQAMQANPKFKDTARALIKAFRGFERILNDPATHLERQGMEHESERLPMLEFAIDSVLSDGRINTQEEDFLRNAALNIGISLDTFERTLNQKAEEAGAVRAQGGHSGPTLPPINMVPGAYSDSSDPNNTVMPADDPTEERKLKGARGHGWWDAAFTRMLRFAIPGGPGDMVDIYCRTALSATTVLPERPLLSYIGVDRNPERLEYARRGLPAGWETRVHLTPGEPHKLPIPNESVDYVLAIRALANLSDTRPVFEEAMRVLRPGGRMIVAEPDGLAETFYFNRNLSDYNDAFHRLCQTVDQNYGVGVDPYGKPGIALGPQLSKRMELAGMQLLSAWIHTSHNLTHRPWGKMARRMRRYPMALSRAASLPKNIPELRAVHAAVDALDQQIEPTTSGMCGHTLDLFLCVGVKDS
jgi:SAM-dependent methyltransferase